MSRYFGFVLVVLLLQLASCDHGTKKSLGVARKAPDETSVSKKRPLYVPPKFDLVPPEEATTQSTKKKLTPAEQSFIDKINTSTNNAS